MLVNEKTTQFGVWPHMVTLEGPAEKLAAVIEALYNDPRLPRDKWGLGNTDGIGRLAMVRRLRSEGQISRRVGVAALTSTISDIIEGRVRDANVKCFVMHLPGLGV